MNHRASVTKAGQGDKGHVRQTLNALLNTWVHRIFLSSINQAWHVHSPRAKQIKLHTLRHWKATMEYHRTLNIKYVQQLLGHKKLENTYLYTQLINFESDEWHAAHARNLEEESKLIEAGFEYVRYSGRTTLQYIENASKVGCSSIVQGSGSIVRLSMVASRVTDPGSNPGRSTKKPPHRCYSELAH